jgi:hypothetical protein
LRVLGDVDIYEVFSVLVSNSQDGLIFNKFLAEKRHPGFVLKPQHLACSDILEVPLSVKGHLVIADFKLFN